ncbi:MAG TPA: L-fucokinase [Rectinemataceae bacterium]|nr:L-fucokinase [Rectinemataceae bacterium]
MPIFDTCIITASGEKQARVFRQLIARRIERGLYPREIDFRVYADPPAGRVGSGGGTVWALACLLREEGLASGRGGLGGAPGGGPGGGRALADRSILLIHAGGESRRLPAYMPEGKLFAPVSVDSSSALPPVVLDLELSLFLKYPWRRGEVLVAAGDALVDFNTEFLDLPDSPLCGFAAPASFEQGSRHGAFAFDPLTGAVRDYFQKAAPEVLAAHGRIAGSETCALDLGLVSFRDGALDALVDLAGARLSGGSVAELLAASKLSFDLYLELLTACLSGLDREDYRARIAGRSQAGRELLDVLYDRFHPFGLAGVLVKQSAFIHFGSVAEFPAACRELRSRAIAPFYAQGREELSPELSEALVRFDSLETEVASGPGGVCIENCRRVKLACEGENLLVGLRDLELGRPLSRGLCLDERSVPEGRLRLAYHKDDSFKPQPSLDLLRFCGEPLVDWLAERRLEAGDLFPGRAAEAQAAFDLQAAELFVLDAEPDFLEGYWRLPADPAAWALRFRSGRRLSIAAANASSDAAGRDAEREEARRAELAAALGRGGFSALSALDFAALVPLGLDLQSLAGRCAATDEPLLKAYRSALLRAAGVQGLPASDRIELSFASSAPAGELRCAVKLDQIVWARAPLRLDLAGGWTDTPPYTNRYGGAVVNVAVDLNGQSPIQVFVRRTHENVVRLHSIDLGLDETIADTASLRAYRDPSRAFSLPRAALTLLGLGAGLPDGAPLGPVLAAAGGGLEITLLCAVPKGSGLGTSSILAGTILAALERFFGRASLSEELFLQVLEVEQMLTTGGGWQDQIGGLVGGLKLLESRPAIKPRPLVRQLDPWLFEDPACVRRMTLYYTGVTRLAKNILKDVVDRVNGMGRSYLFTHARLAGLAREASDAISLRDLDRLGRIIGESFRENKLVHESTTNPEIEAMAAATRPFCSGMKLLGAGGGGFAFFISPTPEAAQSLRSLLASRFEDDRARLVDLSLNKVGLEVTVS